MSTCVGWIQKVRNHWLLLIFFSTIFLRFQIMIMMKLNYFCIVIKKKWCVSIGFSCSNLFSIVPIWCFNLDFNCSNLVSNVPIWFQLFQFDFYRFNCVLIYPLIFYFVSIFPLLWFQHVSYSNSFQFAIFTANKRKQNLQDLMTGNWECNKAEILDSFLHMICKITKLKY